MSCGVRLRRTGSFHSLFQRGAGKGGQVDAAKAVFRGQHKGFWQIVAGHDLPLFFCFFQKIPCPVGGGGVVHIEYAHDVPNKIINSFHTSFDNGKTWQKNSMFIMAVSKDQNMINGFREQHYQYCRGGEIVRDNKYYDYAGDFEINFS